MIHAYEKQYITQIKTGIHQINISPIKVIAGGLLLFWNQNSGQRTESWNMVMY